MSLQVYVADDDSLVDTLLCLVLVQLLCLVRKKKLACHLGNRAWNTSMCGAACTTQLDMHMH